MDDETLTAHLRRFGLSEKEIDTYLTVLEHGSAKASTIADAADVSKRYVYSISEDLEDRGFVTVEDHAVPTEIRANPPSAVLERLSEELQSMGPALESRYSAVEPTDDQFEVVKSRATVLKRLAQRVAAAEEEVIVSLPASRLSELREPLGAAVDRGVLVLLVVSNVDPTELEPGPIASVVRGWSEPMPTMVVADRQSGLVAPTEMITRAASGQQAIAFAQQQLGPVIVGSFFGNYWPTATEVAVAAPAPLPQRYTDFRHAVLQATLYRQRGAELDVTVEGRLLDEDTDDQEVELTGRLVDTIQGLIEPETNEFPVEHSLTVETEEGRYTVGGEGAFIEDIEAASVTLELAE